MNPFKENGQMLPIASINSVYVEDVLASNLFRPELIVNEIKKDRDFLGFSSEIADENLLVTFNGALNNDSKEIVDKANKIAISFGIKLANVLITLKNPSSKSVLNRPSWIDKHWDYWKGVKNLYFVGGLTSPILTSIFYTQIMKELNNHDINDLKVSFIEGSVDLGTKGLSNITVNGEYLLFDFGQTNIKRRHIVKEESELVIDSILPSVKSKYLFYKQKSEKELFHIANQLDSFIINTIIDTVNIVNYKGSNMLIGIANYVIDGNTYSARGGYGKLAFIKGNYEEHLSNEISVLLQREIIIRLYHDTSAMALNFKNTKRTAVVSLGTAFGIAFPE
ncbi:MAG: hypothetical protein KAH16_02895 [Candidatus Izimaplasma sp.]|nr:hypothetical protein [Candidatus Izimaplasma bacterium]